MRNRETGYKHYGLSDKDVDMVLDYCRNCDAEKEVNIRSAILSSNPDLEEQLLKSLIHGKSYEKLYKQEYIPIGEKDFYGYRRKAIYELYCLVVLLGELIAE